MKKICLIAPRAYPLFNPKIRGVFGGSELQLYLLGKTLVEDAELELSFLVGDYGQSEIEYYNRIKLIKALYFKRSIISRIYNFYQSFKKANADIYIQTTLTFFSPLIGLYCRLKGKKLIYRVASNAELDSNRGRRKYGFWAYFFGRSVFRFADTVTAQNSYQRSKLKKDANINTVLIRNGCFFTKTDQRKGETILWVGRSDPWKKPELFLKLATEYPDLSFIMICTPSTTNNTIFEEISEKAKRIGNLKFIDFVPFGEIDNYFAEARLFVCTSGQEGFPNTFLQACAVKIPILSFKVNPDNFLHDSRCGLCADGDWGRFKEMFVKLFYGKLWAEYGANGRLYVERYHDIKKTAAEYKKLFT